MSSFLHRVVADTRPFYLIVDTRHRVGGTTSHPVFSISPYALVNVKRMRLKSFTMANTISNVVNRNNKFIWTRGGTTYTIDIPNGQYTLSELVTYIEDEMNIEDSGNDYAFTYDTKTFRVTIKGNNAFKIDFERMVTCHKLLGFADYGTLVVDEHVADNPPDISHPTSVFLQINEANSQMYSTGPIPNAWTLCIPLLSSNGEYSLHAENATYPSTFELGSPTNFNGLTMRLFDIYAREIELNGGHWSALFEVEK